MSCKNNPMYGKNHTEKTKNGKNPDFISFDKKEIIELFGSYWHKKEEEKLRANHFKKYGYKTLIIWDYELKEKNKVLNKINSFIK